MPDQLTAGSARDAVRMVLHEGRFRTAAHRIRDELAAMPDPRQAVDALERLAARASAWS